MKITFITDTLNSGGAERVISILANEMSRENAVEIVCLRGSKSFYPISKRVHLIFLETKYGNNLFRKFFWLFKNAQRDSLVVAFMVKVYVFSLVALLFRKVKVIVSERNDPTSHPFYIRILRWLLIYRSQRIVVQTQDIANYFPKCIQNKIDIVYNPVSNKYVWKSALSANKERVIMTIGRLSPQKNHKMLINSFEEVVKIHPEYQLHIYGEGEIREDLDAYILSKNLQDKVILKGRSNSLEQILPKADIFVMSSNYEGMSNALIEAMYVGVPVVTTNVSGTKELIDNGKNGFIVPLKNERALTAALITLVENSALRESFAKEAVEIIKWVNVPTIIDKWQEIFNKVWKE